MPSEPWDSSSVWKETGHSLKGMSLEKFKWPAISRLNCFHIPDLDANGKRGVNQGRKHMSSDSLEPTDKTELP